MECRDWSALEVIPSGCERIADGAALLPGFALADAGTLLTAIEAVQGAAPWRHMLTPAGQRMSVAMTNCGRVGWITDRRGYRYETRDPLTGRPWPVMPPLFSQLAACAAAAAGFDGFQPDACLINCYEPGTRLSLHQDRDERDLSAPVVSVSLGLPAMFLFGGQTRRDPVRHIALCHGDILVWGGPQRLAFHGVRSVGAGAHAATGRRRINLTLRHAL